jgi:hypothetical protein
VVWLVAPESATQSVTGVWGAGVVELRQLATDWGSHSPNHGVKGDDCCGGSSVNEGPSCCTERPYWGAVKKAYGVDQCRAPPIGGSKEDSQTRTKGPAPVAGPTCCNGKPYWGATKQACGGQGVGGAHGGAYEGASDGDRGSACKGANGGCSGQGVDGARGGVSGALTSAVKKGRPTGGWRRAAAVAPVTVPAREPTATTSPTARSREVAAAT